MNKERYNQIIDEVYENYHQTTLFTSDSTYLKPIHGFNTSNGEETVGVRQYMKEEFINKCKSDNEFSERWGLKIEERELSLDERIDYALSKDDFRFTDAIINEEDYEKFGIPTKQITLEYNGTKIEVYE